MSPGVHHRIGSVTKTFTVSLLLQAAADGLLSLDDTVDRYVDGVPNGDSITLRQMANMTSGIASYTLDE
jgi:D-alanyl-D-alanine carboxypeptidase